MIESLTDSYEQQLDSQSLQGQGDVKVKVDHRLTLAQRRDEMQRKQTERG